MLRDKVNAEIKKILDYWNDSIEMMEREPGRLAPDFRNIDEYRRFALEMRAEPAIVPLRSLLRDVEEMAESQKTENREYAKALLSEGEVSLCTEGWKAFIPEGKWSRYKFFSAGNILNNRLPGDGGFEATVRNAHRQTSEVLGYSNW